MYKLILFLVSNGLFNEKKLIVLCILRYNFLEYTLGKLKYF